MDLFGRDIRFNIVEMHAERKSGIWPVIRYIERLQASFDSS
jgi:hypothetical protein